MPSARFEALADRIETLRESLLPEEFDETGTYNSAIHEHARGFRLLAHAEFEAYLEDRVSDVALYHYSEWKNSKKPTRAIVGMIAYFEGNLGITAPTSILTPPPNKRSPLLDERIEKAKDWLIKYAKSRNHGVKEDNILKLLLPLGVEVTDIETDWLSTIESWATTRGEYAHTSGRKARTLPDPQDEYQVVKIILQGFEKVDELLESLS